MSKPTTIAMLDYFDCGWSGNDYELPCNYHSCSEYKNGKCIEAREAIRSLIEHGPTVSRKFVTRWAEIFHGDITATRFRYDIIAMLREAGVTVKEEK